MPYVINFEPKMIEESIGLNIGDGTHGIKLSQLLSSHGVKKEVIKEAVDIANNGVNFEAAGVNENGAAFKIKRNKGVVESNFKFQPPPEIDTVNIQPDVIVLPAVKALELSSWGKITQSIKGFFGRMETVFWWVFWILLIVLGVYLYFRFKK